MTMHMEKTWFDGEKLMSEQIPEEKIYDPNWGIEYCKRYAAQLRDKTRANRAEHAAECIEYLLSVVQKEWIGLTPEEVREISLANRPYVVDMVVALEQRLKEKNT